MEVKEIKDKNIWEGFLAQCQEKSFLQSWNWGEFQEKNGLPAGRQGNKIWRIGVYDGGKLENVALVVKISAKRGTFLLTQHLLEAKKLVLEALLGKLKEIAKEENAIFIRLAPLWLNNEENIKIFKNLGFKDAPMHASAYEATWKLDLEPAEDELLENMRKTTRYLIRQAEKNPDIVIEKNNKPESLEIYQKLNREVAKRQKFVPFSDEYIKNEFEVFAVDNQAIWLFGKYKNEIAAGALVIFWAGVGFYHQAASDSRFANFSPTDFISSTPKLFRKS